MKSQFKFTADLIIESLNYHKINCYLWSEAGTGSCYIRFEDPRLGSIRISDHNGKKHLKYKYNVRFDFINATKRFKNGYMQFFYPPNKLDLLIFNIINANKRIKQLNRPVKYNYIIPKFKR